MGLSSEVPARVLSWSVSPGSFVGPPDRGGARSLQVSEGILWNRVKNERDEAERAKDPNALSEPERAELARSRKLTAQQAIDMEILRKAAAYFERETNR